MFPQRLRLAITAIEGRRVTSDHLGGTCLVFQPPHPCLPLQRPPTFLHSILHLPCLYHLLPAYRYAEEEAPHMHILYRVVKHASMPRMEWNSQRHLQPSETHEGVECAILMTAYGGRGCFILESVRNR